METDLCHLPLQLLQAKSKFNLPAAVHQHQQLCVMVEICHLCHLIYNEDGICIRLYSMEPSQYLMLLMFVCLWSERDTKRQCAPPFPAPGGPECYHANAVLIWLALQKGITRVHICEDPCLW